MRTHAEWQAWAKRDPLWAVASWSGRERDGANPWTDEEFYALGADWLDFDRAWRDSIGHSSRSILEIGCGAGRITRMLADPFSRVIAVDVASDAVLYAQSRVLADNIVWRVGTGDVLPADDASVDSIFSCHVFQHFHDNAAQLHAFKEIRRVLLPGGTFFVHIPLHTFPAGHFSAIAHAGYAAFCQLQRLHAHVQRQLMRVGAKPPMRVVSYEMELLHTHLRTLGFIDVGVSMATIGAGSGVHPCIYGRRS